MTWEDINRPWIATAQRWMPRRIEPLRLRAWFSSPLAFDGATAITIEGPLQFAMIGIETGRLPDDVFSGAPRDRPIPLPIPIADVTIADLPIACASWGIAPPIAVESVRWRRKRARAEALGLSKVQINGGAYKSLNIPVGSLVTPWLDFYVRGDRELITQLCPFVQGLGRDSTRGMGTVLGIEITDDPDDRSLLFRGAPQRAIPILCDGSEFDPRRLTPDTWDERETTTRAPYWKQTSLAVCAVPNSMFYGPDELSGAAPTAPTNEARTSAAGRFFITPKAVARFIERFAPSLSFDRALAELIRLTSDARFIGPYLGEQIRLTVPEAELWRTPRERSPAGADLATSRMRFIVGHGEPGRLPQVITVLPRRKS